MPRRQFYVDQLDELYKNEKTWVTNMLNDVASRHFKKQNNQDYFSFTPTFSWSSFLKLQLPLEIKHQQATVQTLLDKIHHYEALPLWRKLVYFLFSQKHSFIRKARELVSFAGIKALFHYKHQMDPLAYRGIKTMLQKHESKVSHQLGEITKAFFGDWEEINDKKEKELRTVTEYEKELIEKNKVHLTWVYQSALKKLQSVLNDTTHFHDKVSRQQEWAAIKQWVDEEVKPIEDYYKDEHWTSETRLFNDWLDAARASISGIINYGEIDLAPFIKCINMPIVKWQYIKGPVKVPQLVMGSHKTPEAHRQIIIWVDAQLPYRPLLPDQVSRWALDKKYLISIVIKPLFDEIFNLKEINNFHYTIKQKALSEELITLVKKHRFLIEETYSLAMAKKLLIPFDKAVYQEIQSFFSQLEYIVDHIDEVLHKHLENEKHELLQEILNKSDMILENLEQGQTYLRNILRLRGEINQLAEQTLARMDRYITNANELKKGFTELQEQVAENGRRIDEMIQDDKELEEQIDAFDKKIEGQLTSNKKELDAISTDNDKRIKQIEQQLLTYIEKKPKLQKYKNTLLSIQSNKAISLPTTPQLLDHNYSFQQSGRFFLFKSNLTTATPLPESVFLEHPLNKYSN